MKGLKVPVEHADDYQEGWTAFSWKHANGVLLTIEVGKHANLIR
jgi:hypothetical protein